MKIIKENKLYYESFCETLPNFTRDTISKGLKPVTNRFNFDNKRELYYKNISLLKFLELQNKVNESNNFIEIEAHFADYIKNTLKLGEANLFFLDKKHTVIESVSHSVTIRTKAFLNTLLSSGVINEIIEKKTCLIIPNDLLKNFESYKTSFLLMPLISSSKNCGCLVVKVRRDMTTDSPEIIPLKIGVDIISKKIEMFDKQLELKNIYNELQIFQSRLANDYRLSVIGELTTGILEDILSPLQVILSYTEFVKNEEDPNYNAALDTVNLQTKKISRVVNRLINFANPIAGKLNILPCEINDFIIEFYEVVNSTLKKDNYECILDLDKNIPNILTHPNYINQILMNVFLLLKPAGNKAGGVLLQTKYLDGKVLIKYFTTDYFENLESKGIVNTKDVNIKIIQNLIRQHQAELIIGSDKTNGTIITISFPIKRKM